MDVSNGVWYYWGGTVRVYCETSEVYISSNFAMVRFLFSCK